MRKIKGKLGVLLFGLVGFVNISHAALNDLGNGLVNDTTLNITWMKDANLVKSSCDANDALWQAFDPTTVTSNSGRTKAQICTANGALNWFEAEAWMVVLNTQNYLGHNDWRQPLTAQPDASCSFQIAASGGFPAQGYGYNCAEVGSELNHLFYTSLSNPNDQDDNCYNPPASNPNHCFQNTTPFDNAQSFAYWSGSEYAPDTARAWGFGTNGGVQGFGFKDDGDLYVWPVRSGQSVVAPVTPQHVPSLSIWGLGIMSLLLAFVARRKAR